LNAPDVTIGVVSWNARDQLLACLDALPAALEGLSAQTVVVDNGSSDGTWPLLEQREDVDAIHNARNVGLTPGRNQILARSRGRALLMLDSDTRPLPGSVRTLVEYLDAHPRVGLAGAMLLDPDGSLQLSCRTFPPLLLPFMRRPPLAAVFEHRRTVNSHLMRDYDHARPRTVDWVMGACQCTRGDLARSLGGYDERIFSHGGEDTDWCVRTWKAGYEVHYVPGARVIHDYGHFTRRNPLSKQALRGLLDYFYMQAKHRDARGGLARPR
jgi:GT2 family glycosyltransferase